VKKELFRSFKPIHSDFILAILRFPSFLTAPNRSRRLLDSLFFPLPANLMFEISPRVTAHPSDSSRSK